MRLSVQFSSKIKIYLGIKININKYDMGIITIILYSIIKYDKHICLFDFFCSPIQLYVLLSPNLCFISFLYLNLYVLGDNAWMRYGSFMQTKHLCFLNHIRTLGEAGAVKPFKALQYSNILRTAPKRYFFCGSFVLFRARLFIGALWSPAGKGLAPWLSFVMSNCKVVTFPLLSLVRCGA